MGQQESVRTNLLSGHQEQSTLHTLGIMSRLRYSVIVVAIITINWLPAWDIHLVPEAVRSKFNFRYGYQYITEYDLLDPRPNKKAEEEGLALKAHLREGDSIVASKIGRVGYYSGLHIYDRNGLVTRSVALRELQADESLRMPGHDKKVSTDYFYDDVPTVTVHRRLFGKDIKDLRHRIRLLADDLRRQVVWRRYSPELIPLRLAPNGDLNVYFIFRLIEEPERTTALIRSLPRSERVAMRKERARKVWAAFYSNLDNWEAHQAYTMKRGNHERREAN